MRGAGYWLWKPYIILDAMAQVPDGTPVLYADCGVEYVDDPAPLLSLLEGRDIVLFDNRLPEWTQAAFTKRDCFVLMDADIREHWNARQLDAAFQLYRAGPVARAFLTELRDCMRDPRILTDIPNELGRENLPEFVDHRHDQSVLTVLARNHGVETFRSPAIPPQDGDERSRYPKIFDQHRRKNKKLGKYLRMRLKRALWARPAKKVAPVKRADG